MRPSVGDPLVADDGKGLSIRRMRDATDDYALLLRWLNTPEVAEWWNPERIALTLDGIITEYGPQTRSISPGGYWAIDIFIGEPDHLNRGLGSRAVSLMRRYLTEECGAIGIALVVARDNLRAQRAYEKAGLVRQREVLDTDTRDGKRIPSYLMVSP